MRQLRTEIWINCTSLVPPSPKLCILSGPSGQHPTFPGQSLTVIGPQVFTFLLTVMNVWSLWKHSRCSGHTRMQSLFFFFTFYFAIEYSWLTVFWCFQRDSAIHILVPILPQTPFPSRLPHSPEQSSLCCIVGLCLFICFLIFCNCFIKENDNKMVFCRCSTFFVWWALKTKVHWDENLRWCVSNE